ncbi:hypothetical protein SK128_022200 [Halocaridina rubra]|uniref:Uncharacterized protein n=1 Tax=Halocaridina rubra TaxID=373956 RepID=A0AAN8WQB2_HALRR
MGGRALEKGLGRLGLQRSLCSSNHLRIGVKFRSLEMFLQLWKEVIVGGGQVWRGKWVINQFEAKIACFRSFMCCVCWCIALQKQYTTAQLSTVFLLQIFMQFVQQRHAVFCVTESENIEAASIGVEDAIYEELIEESVYISIMDSRTLRDHDGVFVSLQKVNMGTNYVVNAVVTDFADHQILLIDNRVKVYNIDRVCEQCRPHLVWRNVHQQYKLERGSQLCEDCTKQSELPENKNTLRILAWRWHFGNSGQISIRLQNYQGLNVLHLIGSQHQILNGWKSVMMRMIVNIVDERFGKITLEHGFAGLLSTAYTVRDKNFPVLHIYKDTEIFSKGETYYTIYDANDNTEKGRIHELVSEAAGPHELHKCYVEFPHDDVKMKALVIGAAFLMNYKNL